MPVKKREQIMVQICKDRGIDLLNIDPDTFDWRLMRDTVLQRETETDKSPVRRKLFSAGATPATVQAAGQAKGV